MSMPSTETDRAIDSAKDVLNRLTDAFFELGIYVHDFQGTEGSREGMAIKVNATIDDLKQLTAPHSKPLDNVPIPLDVLQYIEDGRNPDVYTREFVEATRKSNQYLRGKMVAMRELRDVLGQKISAEFPELGSAVIGVIQRTNG